MGKGKDGPCCRAGGSCGGTEVGSCCYADPSGIGCASKSLMSVNLGLTVFFILYPGIWLFIGAFYLLDLGIVPGLAMGFIFGFLAQLVLLGATCAGMCCCTGSGCCGQVGSAVATLVGCFFAFIAVICAAVDHANLATACGDASCVALDALMGVFYAGVVIPMILGAITAGVNFMHNSAITSGGKGGVV